MKLSEKWESASKKLRGFLHPSDADRGFSAALDDCAAELRERDAELRAVLISLAKAPGKWSVKEIELLSEAIHILDGADLKVTHDTR